MPERLVFAGHFDQNRPQPSKTPVGFAMDGVPASLHQLFLLAQRPCEHFD
jgi:hypothetical protein